MILPFISSVSYIFTDPKLKGLVDVLKPLIRDGYNPIVFCRFIPTVTYLTEELRKVLRNVEVEGVTGLLPPAERELRVNSLIEKPRRVLVCTDCLSEGVNLQEGFDAVVHYDLSWNPTRHEQREGRVDRYGQPSPTVKVITYYGKDNQIDGIVLRVLLRKHETIRDSLGVSVPVPGNTEELIEAIFEGLLLRENEGMSAQILPGFEEYMKPRQQDLNLKWEEAAAREKRSRTMFAQQTIKVDEVKAELDSARSAVGSGVDVARFLSDAITMYGGIVSPLATPSQRSGEGRGGVHADLTEAPRGLRERLDLKEKTRFDAQFELPVKEGQLLLTRTHPLIESLAAYVMDTALDPIEDSRARRSGAVRTKLVERRTTVLLVRFRYHILTTMGEETRQLLAEDCQTLAFEGAPDNAAWIDTTLAERLMNMERPDENIDPMQAVDFVGRVIAGFEHLAPKLETIAEQRGIELLDAHRRVRTAARMRGIQYKVEAQLPPDVLGIYVYLPAKRV